MPLPCVFAGRDGARYGAVLELGILHQTPPEAEFLPCVIALVDQMVLVCEGIVDLDQGVDGAIPGLLFERTPLAEAELDRFAERAEEGGLICGCPAEARPAMLSGRMGGAVGANGAEVNRHGRRVVGQPALARREASVV